MRRYLSRSATGALSRRDAPPPAKPPPPPQVTYEGALRVPLRGFKLASLGTFCVSALSSPMVSVYSYPYFPLFAKSAVATTMVALSAASSGILHWYAGPYVSRLHWDRVQPFFEVEMFDILGLSRRKTIYFADVKRPLKKRMGRPLVTFSAHGEHYFVEEDAFPDEELWGKLVRGSKRHRSFHL